jgi:protein SCO1/2
MKTRLIRLFFIIIFALVVAGGIAAYQIKHEEKGKKSFVVVKDFGGPFELVNQDGEIRTQDDFKNQWRLIYFGFTYCPAICPTELQKITSVLNELGSKSDIIQPVFITVDPERDDVETMKQYINLFHPRFVGLTGTQAQIDQAKKSYKIFAQKVKDETMTNYTMDHSSFIYLIDPNNNLLRIFKTDDSSVDMVKYIKSVL